MLPLVLLSPPSSAILLSSTTSSIEVIVHWLPPFKCTRFLHWTAWFYLTVYLYSILIISSLAIFSTQSLAFSNLFVSIKRETPSLISSTFILSCRFLDNLRFILLRMPLKLWTRISLLTIDQLFIMYCTLVLHIWYYCSHLFKNMK